MKFLKEHLENVNFDVRTSPWDGSWLKSKKQLDFSVIIQANNQIENQVYDRVISWKWNFGFDWNL
jgi:hypothetical protein